MNNIELDMTMSLEKYPFSRIKFITIRDPKQLWRIGKANDWIKRFSSCYYIVMSPHGGTHFHIVAGIQTNIELTPSKGIHFDIKSVGQPTQINIPTREEQFESDCYKRVEKISRLEIIMKLQIPHQSIHISNSIKKHFLKLASKKNKIKILNKKTSDIGRILNYMSQNLFEDRDDFYIPEKYIDYLYKCPVKLIPTRGHHVPLGDGIRMLRLGQ